MSGTKQSSSLLAITISILGILTIALFFGLLLMQKKENDNLNIAEALSMAQPPKSDKSFDPASWAKDGVEYPPLQKRVEPEKLAVSSETGKVYSYDGKDALPEEPKKTGNSVETNAAPVPANPIVKKIQPAVKSATKAKPVVNTKSSYRKLSENGYWIQVFATENIMKAEEIRDYFVNLGIPAVIQIYGQEATRKYRIRIGAFSNIHEAENLASSVQQIHGFEKSFVIMSPVVRQIPIG